MRSTKFQDQHLGRSVSPMAERYRTRLWPPGWVKRKITKKRNEPIIDGQSAMLPRPQADMTQLWKENSSENPIGSANQAMKTTDAFEGSALADADEVEGTETICVHQPEPSTR